MSGKDIKENSFIGSRNSPTTDNGRPSSSTGGGKVTHDARGNAVWEWAMATGVFARIKASDLLSMLENPTLALESDCLTADEWAGDPYNRRQVG